MASNMVNLRCRKWLLRNFKFIHSLYQQYAPDQMETVSQTSAGAQKVIIPKEILGLDFTLGIAGLGGALDKESRRTDMMMLGQWLMQTPLLQGNLPRIWTMARLVAETFDIPEVTALIGTMDDAIEQAKSQAEAAQAQEKKEFLMQILSHGKYQPQARGQGGGGGQQGGGGNVFGGLGG